MSLFPTIGRATATVLFADIASPFGELTPEDWFTDVPEILGSRLGPTALRVARNIPVPDEVVRACRDDTYAWRCKSAEAIQLARAPLSLLSKNGIDFAVIKGPGIAASYPMNFERPFSDVDILTHPRDFGKSLFILTGAGMLPTSRAGVPRDYFRRWCTEGVNLVGTDGARIDVHHHIPPWIWAKRLTAERVLASAAPVEVVVGLKLPVVQELDNLLIAALHIFSDKNRPGGNLLAWRDVLLLLQKFSPYEVHQAAARYQLEPWLTWILSSYPSYVDVEAHLSLLRSSWRQLPHRWRLNARASLKARATGVCSADGTLLYALRLPALQAAMYLAGHAVPSREFLKSRSPEERHIYLRRFRRALAEPWK